MVPPMWSPFPSFLGRGMSSFSCGPIVSELPSPRDYHCVLSLLICYQVSPMRLWAPCGHRPHCFTFVLPGDVGLVLRLGRSPGEGHGNPLQYSCLENPTDRRAWQAMVHRVAKSQTQLKRLSRQHICTPYHSSHPSALPSSVCLPICSTKSMRTDTPPSFFTAAPHAHSEHGTWCMVDAQ